MTLVFFASSDFFYDPLLEHRVAYIYGLQYGRLPVKAPNWSHINPVGTPASGI